MNEGWASKIVSMNIMLIAVPESVTTILLPTMPRKIQIFQELDIDYMYASTYYSHIYILGDM